ncbi:MAG: EAL domain-containing protein [Rhodocyclaceae bacterium]
MHALTQSTPQAQEGGPTAVDEDPLLFSDEEILPADTVAAPAGRWRILMVDDDVEVHRATVFALRGVQIDGCGLELMSAYSAAEAEKILREQQDIAVIILDVVMETPHAGLELVRTIREDIGLAMVRIVLRTGQPGYAPELDVIRRFDINDYRTKSELTQTRLITTLTAAIRAYAQLEATVANNRGLSRIVRWTNELFRIRSSHAFAAALLERLGELLACPANGAVCMGGGASDGATAEAQILEAVGRFVPLAGQVLDHHVDPELLRAVRRCCAAKTTLVDGPTFALWLGSPTRDAVVYFDAGRALSDVERRLLNVFASSLSAGFENVDLFERLDFFAFFDPLTRLPNRARFVADVDKALLSAALEPRCLVIADIVRFSDINDALGHRCGDALLVAAGKRLRASVGGVVCIARISGDAFALFGPVRMIDAAAMRSAFEAPFFVHGHALSVQIRLGIVRANDTRESAAELLRSANLALNEARQTGGAASSVFTRAMSENVRDRVALLHNLRAAIDFRRGLSVHYQPQVNGRTGEVLGVEALLRWRNDYGEMISPDRFVPLAERTGMIGELGLWVMEEAVERLSIWKVQGYEHLRMSVNISPVQLRSDEFGERLRHALALADLPAERITLEITESVRLEENDAWAAQVESLRALGVRFAIDDFGTGFSSLQQLTRLPANIVKIDRGFVADVARSPSDRAVVASVIMLAGSRDLEVLAEGVETEEQRTTLLELGCEHMQGFYFGRPMTAEAFDDWMQGRALA